MYGYLLKSHSIHPSAYSTKWLGIINLYNGDLQTARKFLNESLKFNKKDSRVLYNLALSYFNYNKNNALEYTDKALEVDPNYKKAIDLRGLLIKSMK
jgi:tetratricopeptide (TPR) repeat protein